MSYFDSVIISVLLGSPGKRHPVLGQALACLFGSFKHLLSSLHDTDKQEHKINKEKRENKENFRLEMCVLTLCCYYLL